jgi:hypothetical protein
MLRYAALHDFMKKNDQKKFRKKKLEKKIRKFSVNFFFHIFLGYRCSTANLESAYKKFGGLGPLV